ncbi:MAG: hypothetical protein WC626_07770 [Methanoregula sp.]
MIAILPYASYTPGIDETRSMRYLPPPRRAPRGGLNDRKNLRGPPAIDCPAEQVIRRYRNRGMPMRRGQSPQERQILVKKRTPGCDFKKENGEIEGARS